MILTGGIAFMLAANAALLRLGLFPSSGSPAR
ncbi:hypothetical protein SMICM17S_10721 [Streptomyces microflavus]